MHGGIDGYSRFIPYLKTSTNNRAHTVFEHFTGAVEPCGIPSRVRTDHGGEDVYVWQFMERARGENRGSYIAVHPQPANRMTLA